MVGGFVQVIKGLDQGILGGGGVPPMHVGETRTIYLYMYVRTYVFVTCDIFGQVGRGNFTYLHASPTDLNRRAVSQVKNHTFTPSEKVFRFS